MKIKKVNEMNENFEKNILEGNDKIQNLKSLLEDVYEDAVENVSYDENDGYYSVSFNDYWDLNGDRLIQKIGLLEKTYTKSEVEKLILDAVDDNNGNNRTVKYWIKNKLD